MLPRRNVTIRKCTIRNVTDPVCCILLPLSEEQVGATNLTSTHFYDTNIVFCDKSECSKILPKKSAHLKKICLGKNKYFFEFKFNVYL